MAQDNSIYNKLAKELATDLVKGRNLLNAAACGTAKDWQNVLEFRNFWQIRHEQDGSYSVADLSLEEIKKALVEDLLFVKVEQSQGSLAYYPKSQLYRHLGRIKNNDSINDDIQSAIESLTDMGLIAEGENDFRIREGKFEEAQKFSGFWMNEDEQMEPDFVETMLQTGGEALLSDALEDIIEEMDREGLN